MSNKVLRVWELKPIDFIDARKLNYNIGYKMGRKRLEWAKVECRSEEDCELTIHYNYYNPETYNYGYRTITIVGTRKELEPLVYIIELCATENTFYR